MSWSGEAFSSFSLVKMRLLTVMLMFRDVWTSAALVLPPAEVLLVRQRAGGDLGLALVRRQQHQAQRDGGRPGLRHGPAQNR